MFTKIVAVALAASLTMSSCSKWTETESIDYERKTLEDVNPELHKKYLESLCEYRDSEHKVVVAKFDNTQSAPRGRAEHIACLPDSVDYVILNNADNLHAKTVLEMEDIRNERKVKTLFSIDYREIEKEYEAMIAAKIEATEKASAEKASAEKTVEGSVEGEDVEEKPIHTIERMEEWISAEVEKKVALVDKYNYDGINVIYRGKSPLSFTEEVRNNVLRIQEAFFGNIVKMMAENPDKVVFFEGLPKNLIIDGTFLKDVKFIIISAKSAVSVSEFSYAVNQQISENIPADKYIIAVTTVNNDDPADKEGLFSNDRLGNLRSAIVGAAQWVVMSKTEYTKAGICIDHAQRDYYDLSRTYREINTAISIMNPSVNK